MNHLLSKRRSLSMALLIAALSSGASAAGPAVGDKAPETKLKNLSSVQVSLAELQKSGPVVVLFLRGYPGYQCPACNKQVGAFLAVAEKFKEAGANILLIYPGPSEKLQQHAEEFVRGKTLPGNVEFVIDPEYTATNAWKLRWDEKGETAYPSTFVVTKEGAITFAKVSKTHGDRSTPEEVLAALKK